jgi:hypothetical protein
MTTLHIRGRVFAAEEYDFDENTGLVYAHGVMVDNPTVATSPCRWGRSTSST